MDKIGTLAATITGLEYIAESPPQAHGGFHPEAIATARSALYWLSRAKEQGRAEALKEHKDVLDVAREAIADAICCEDGLDGGTGEAVVRWISDVLGDADEFAANHREGMPSLLDDKLGTLRKQGRAELLEELKGKDGFRCREWNNVGQKFEEGWRISFFIPEEQP